MPGFDFAALVEEQEPYTITLTYKRDEDGKLILGEDGEPIAGEQVVLPPVLPAKIMLRFFNKDRKEIERLADSPSGQLQVGLQVIEELIGKDQWDLVTETIGFGNLNPLLTDIFRYYGMGNQGEGEGDGEGEGKAEEGNESQSTISSTTSEPSMQTSNGTIPERGNVSTIAPSGGPHSSQESPTYQPKVSS